VTAVPTLVVVEEQRSLYDEVGGFEFFETLVYRFYDGVESDPALRPVYPEPDLAFARRKLALFLAEYWGGPPAYNELRGHPRLRMRHAGFAIDAAGRDRWLHHMRAAVESLDPPQHVADALLRYFEVGAEAMRNRD
jgi:hemoglobin